MWKCKICGFTNRLAYFFIQEEESGMIMCKDCLMERKIEKEEQRILDMEV